ncbi:cysteine proteinase inhibitor B-like [Diospyros lotus]|uniref:cysteine proteinase inhibitor B-like n=1 Tax=Diospyros lotus TaxID=55363 RepID=UPI002255E31C|nr:cysteine proteinase inhibitor B-like [Diospyros lotus]
MKLVRASILLLCVAVVVAATSLTPAAGGKVGGRTKVHDVKKNEEIQQLGRYSVQQYNLSRQKKTRGSSGGPLEFKEVVEAETQVVSGIKYYLKIAATDSRDGSRKMFDAEVVVKAWLHSKQLLNFAPSPAGRI